jgi:hypothetical protein
VFLPDEWAAEEARVDAEFAAEEDKLKKDELEKMEQLTRGLAADDRADKDPAGPGTADSRRAMRTLFSIMDWNSNGTVERYDMLRAVSALSSLFFWGLVFVVVEGFTLRVFFSQLD